MGGLVETLVRRGLIGMSWICLLNFRCMVSWFFMHERRILDVPNDPVAFYSPLKQDQVVTLILQRFWFLCFDKVVLGSLRTKARQTIFRVL